MKHETVRKITSHPNVNCPGKNSSTIFFTGKIVLDLFQSNVLLESVRLKRVCHWLIYNILMFMVIDVVGNNR